MAGGEGVEGLFIVLLIHERIANNDYFEEAVTSTDDQLKDIRRCYEDL
jgi:hypothetical protein